MIWLKRLGLVLLLAAVGFLGWSWQFGPMRMKRDISQFAMNMESCTAYNLDFKYALSGDTLNWAVLGPEENSCKLRMETHSGRFQHCAFAMRDMPKLANTFAGYADYIGFYGNILLTIDDEGDDPLEEALNGPACEYEE